MIRTRRSIKEMRQEFGGGRRAAERGGEEERWRWLRAEQRRIRRFIHEGG